jgi:predicted DNA-binding protein
VYNNLVGIIMASTKAFRLPDDIREILESTAKKHKRTETFYVIEALKYYFAEYHDYQIAIDRFNDPSDKIISSEEMRERLGL